MGIKPGKAVDQMPGVQVEPEFAVSCGQFWVSRIFVR
jgi:hypothetical protein